MYFMLLYQRILTQKSSAPFGVSKHRYKILLEAKEVILRLTWRATKGQFPCYLPFAVVTAVVATRGLNTSLFLAMRIACTSVFLNSSLNRFFTAGKLKKLGKR